MKGMFIALVLLLVMVAAPLALACSCGDGRLDAGEECDAGGDNGVPCIGGLDDCTYCSDDCEEIVRESPCQPLSDDDVIIDLSSERSNRNREYLRSDYSLSYATMGPLPFLLPAGSYAVTLVSWDGYEGRVYSVQDHEQWFVKLLDDEGDIASSSAIRDLPDGVDYVTISETVDDDLLVDRDAQEIFIEHAFFGDQSSPNSVRPYCAIFTPNPSCGDGLLQSGEECDLGDGNADSCTPSYGSSCSYCSSECTEESLPGPFCGDHVKNGPEECDDNDGVVDHFRCNAQCHLEYEPYCGDGSVDAGEECDLDGSNGEVCIPSYGSSCSYCSGDCTNESVTGPYCGDLIVNGDEECDGSAPDHYTCSGDCELEYVPYCGDGVLNGDDECDLGGLNGVACVPDYGSTCSYCSGICENVTLRGPWCGDGVKNGPEECDGTDGLINGFSCTDDCVLERIPSCGDGFLDTGEECDLGDGNADSCTPSYGSSCSYCSSECTNESLTGPYCGDLIVNGDEECDGSAPDHYTCSQECSLEYVPYCGDLIVNGDDECDLGGLNGDVCVPSYGSTCSYCSGDCENVTLRGPWCGDNILNGNEECDGDQGLIEGFVCDDACHLQRIPQCLDIAYVEPYFTNGSSQWIDTASRVQLLVNDSIQACVEADHYYRYQEADDAYCLGACDAWAPGDGNWTSYGGLFSLPSEACFVIEEYSDTSLGITPVGWDCVFHDATAPLITKTVGEPSAPMSSIDRELGKEFYGVLDPEGDDYCATPGNCFEVSRDTLINVSCEDVSHQPSGVEEVCFTVGLDGDDATASYCEGELTEGRCCMGPDPFTLSFDEESWHELNLTCTDHVNKSSSDTEYFKVRGESFTLSLNKKWNLISVPFTLRNDSPEHVFGGYPEVSGVWDYDASNESWRIWNPGAPSNLDRIIPGKGYWVLTTGEVNVSLYGSEDIHPQLYVDIVAGWNLVGYYGTEGLLSYDGYAQAGDLVSCALASLSTSASDLSFSSLLGYWEPFNPPDPWLEFDRDARMDPGAGYWLFATRNATYAPSTMC